MVEADSMVLKLLTTTRMEEKKPEVKVHDAESHALRRAVVGISWQSFASWKNGAGSWQPQQAATAVIHHTQITLIKSNLHK